MQKGRHIPLRVWDAPLLAGGSLSEPWLGLHASRLREPTASFAFVRASWALRPRAAITVRVAPCGSSRTPAPGPLRDPRFGSQYKGRNPWLAPAFPSLSAFPRRWVATDHPASNDAKSTGGWGPCIVCYGKWFEHSQTIDRPRPLSSRAGSRSRPAGVAPLAGYVSIRAVCLTNTSVRCLRTATASTKDDALYSGLMDYRPNITIEPAKRSGQPCIRGMRTTVYDVLDYLASGMPEAEILADFPELTHEDVLACLAFAADAG